MLGHYCLCVVIGWRNEECGLSLCLFETSEVCMLDMACGKKKSKYLFYAITKLSQLILLMKKYYLVPLIFSTLILLKLNVLALQNVSVLPFFGRNGNPALQPCLRERAEDMATLVWINVPQKCYSSNAPFVYFLLLILNNFILVVLKFFVSVICALLFKFIFIM